MKVKTKTKARFSLMHVAVAVSGIFLTNTASAIVYTLGNEAGANEVIAFDLDEQGGIFEVGRFPTQGTGSGAPLGNQSALTTDASDRWLFATNAGDGSLTSFRLQPDGLQFVNKVGSGGLRPISVTVFGTLVYVLNEGDGASQDPHLRYDNISGFRFTAGGVLVPIPNSTRIIDKTQLTAPAQIGFNKSGTVILITEKATNTITTFVMLDDDTPKHTPLKRPSAVPTPFGFAFGDRDYVFITEANGGGVGSTVSYRVDRETGEVSPLVGRLDQGNATCWAVLNSDQTIGFSANTGSGTISSFKVNFNGTMDFRGGAAIDMPEFTGNGVRDLALTQDNRYLFSLNNGDGLIRRFVIDTRGMLSDTLRRGRFKPLGIDERPRNVNVAPIPTSATGLMAR